MEQINQALSDLLTRFKVQMKTDPATADRSLLQAGIQMLQEYVQISTILDSEIVHLGYTFCYWAGDRQGIVDLMTRYLAQPLSLQEEAWACWEQIDYLAALRQCEMAVGRQKEVLEWAKNYLPKDRLLWVMYDSTQALCWHEMGQGKEWLQIFEEIMSSVVSTPENREDRFQYLRTAAVMWNAQRETQEALKLVDRMHQLCNEETGWESRAAFKLKTYAYAITAWDHLKETEKIADIGRQARTLLEEMERILPDPMTPLQQHDLGIAYDDIGSSLFFAGCYESSIPLERRAIELVPLYEWIYLRLAAATWATSHNRTETLSILKQGAAVSHSGRLKLETRPEFTAVLEDKEFLKAAER